MGMGEQSGGEVQCTVRLKASRASAFIQTSHTLVNQSTLQEEREKKANRRIIDEKVQLCYKRTIKEEIKRVEREGEYRYA